MSHEGYVNGISITSPSEFKHGSLTLVDEGMPVIAVAPNNQLLGELKSNLEEVRVRSGQLYVFADAGADLSFNGSCG